MPFFSFPKWPSKGVNFPRNIRKCFLLLSKIKKGFFLLISISTRKGRHPPLFLYYAPPFLYVLQGYWSIPSASGYLVSHGDAAGHSRDPQREGCHAGKLDQDKENAHHTMTGNRIPSQSPFIWATMTSPLLLQCPMTFSWYLGLSTFLLLPAHLPWRISYLKGKKHLQLQGGLSS